MRTTSYPVYRCAQEQDRPLAWVSLDKAEWLVTSGGARWFRPRKLMLTNHNLYNIQIGDRHHRAGFTVGTLRWGYVSKLGVDKADTAKSRHIIKIENPRLTRVFIGAPGRAHSLGGESPLHARQGEVLAEPQGCPPRGGI